MNVFIIAAISAGISVYCTAFRQQHKQQQQQQNQNRLFQFDVDLFSSSPPLSLSLRFFFVSFLNMMKDHFQCEDNEEKEIFPETREKIQVIFYRLSTTAILKRKKRQKH